MHRGIARNWFPGCPRCAMHGGSIMKKDSHNISGGGGQS